MSAQEYANKEYVQYARMVYQQEEKERERKKEGEEVGEVGAKQHTAHHTMQGHCAEYGRSVNAQTCCTVPYIASRAAHCSRIIAQGTSALQLQF